MKNAQEYKGFYMDILQNGDTLTGIIQGSDITIEGLTIKEVVQSFRQIIDLEERPA